MHNDKILYILEKNNDGNYMIKKTVFNSDMSLNLVVYTFSQFDMW